MEWWTSVHRNPPPVGKRIIVETNAGFVCEAYRSPHTYYRYDGVNLKDDLFGKVERWHPLNGMNTSDPTWELFWELTTAYDNKEMYFLQDNGKVYSRYSCKELPFPEAIREFKARISDLPDPWEDAK